MDYREAVLANANEAALSLLHKSKGYHLKATSIEEPSKWYWRKARDVIKASVPKSELLLDVGCGFGGFSYAMQKKGYDKVFSNDIDKNKLDCIEKALKAVGLNSNILRTSPAEIKAQFRVLTAFDFLYFLSPAEFYKLIETCGKLVENGGLLIFTMAEPSNRVNHSYTNLNRAEGAH